MKRAVQMFYPKLTGQKWKDVGPFYFCCFRCAKNFLWVLSDVDTNKAGARVCVVELPEDHSELCDRCECLIDGEFVNEGS